MERCGFPLGNVRSRPKADLRASLRDGKDSSVDVDGPWNLVSPVKNWRLRIVEPHGRVEVSAGARANSSIDSRPKGCCAG